MERSKWRRLTYSKKNTLALSTGRFNRHMSTMSNTTNNYTPYTIKGNGIAVFIKPLSPVLFRDIDRQYPAPEPPSETVIMADGSSITADNKSHPDYIAALQAREARINAMMADIVIELGVMILLSDEQKEEIKSYRESVERIAGYAMSGSIESQYLKYIALADTNDLSDILRAVMQRMRPDEKKLRSGLSTSAQHLEEPLYGAGPQTEQAQAIAMS